MAPLGVLRGRWLIPFFAGLLLGATLVSRLNRPSPAAIPTAAPSPTPVAAVLSSWTDEEELALDASASVARVIDGDTIELKDGRRVRYLGIDAPEFSRKDCFANESKMANERLVLGKTVRLERDRTDTDRFGRLLRYVYINDTMVNETLVADGFAFASRYPPDVLYAPALDDAMAQAKAAKRGLWGACAAAADAAAVAATPPPGGCSIKGNINTKGEKIYHLPGCGSYEKTVIEETKDEQWFCVENDAIAAGFRKAGNCP
ncbi:MAG: micrococcal nuclease [Parcubacteria group bacterium Gr01-1014_31]|nr:MAG: micrococcal nuclease [Parcubacteria group bacterium Gr01-1014_31]